MRKGQTAEKPNFDTVWAILQEVAKSQRETKLMFKETDLKFKETDRRINETNRQIGKLGSRIGEMIESMVKPNLLEKFSDLGFVFTKIFPNAILKDENRKFITEIDLTLEDGDKVMIVEVKTKPTTENVTEHIERMEKIRAYADSRNDKRKYLAAIAGMVFEDNSKDFALKNGFYVIEPSGETFTITVPRRTHGEGMVTKQ